MNQCFFSDFFWFSRLFTEREFSSNLSHPLFCLYSLLSPQPLFLYLQSSAFLSSAVYVSKSHPLLSCLASPLLKQSSIIFILLCYPSLDLSPPSSQSSRVVPSAGCRPPNIVPVSHSAPDSWAKTDRSMSKSIIIFRQCNLIPEDILWRTYNILLSLTFWFILICTFPILVQKWAGTSGRWAVTSEKKGQMKQKQRQKQHSWMSICSDTQTHGHPHTPSCPDCDGR